MIIVFLGLIFGAEQIFSAATPFSSEELVINEFVASNGTGLTDEDGDPSDWIEIYNAGRTAVNLSGWALTDDPQQPQKWTFPDRVLDSGAYLVVFASGKNRTPPDPDAHLHTNFKLNKAGEFLALYNILDRHWVEVATPGSPEQAPYPRQFRDLAYGRYGAEPSYGYLDEPSPGQANRAVTFWVGVAEAVEFSARHGFYEAPFRLELSSSTPEAVIRYTLDGSEPTEATGRLYTEPILIETTTPVRAVAFKPNFLPSPSQTQTYIFLDDVLQQPADPSGFPATWGTQPKDFRGLRKGEPVRADYEMDPEIVNDPRYRDRLKDDLKAIPTLSLVTDVQYFTELYSNPRERGREWERSVSVEFIDPTGVGPGFQVNGGLRIHGGEVRWEYNAKHAFRLFFRGEYGATRLEYPLFNDSRVESFDTLVLRAGKGGGYAGRPGGDKRPVTYMKDQWFRYSQLEMSGLSAHGRYVHLYINGLYWGLYILVERPDAAFAAAYLGGPEESWFAANHNGPISGPLARVQQLQQLLLDPDTDFAAPQTYALVEANLDIEQFIDYVILNWYTGNTDWPETNWYLTAQEPSGRLQFFVWDGEGIWNDDVPKIRLGPPDEENLVRPLIEGLSQNRDFKMVLADRMYKHLYNDGALTDVNSQERWLRISRLIDRAIVGESARWGDAVNDSPVTRKDWLNARAEVLARMEGNGAQFVAMMRSAGMYPDFDPPQLNDADGLVPVGFELTMALPEDTGDDSLIYYTIDGSDPRLPVTGAVAPGARVYEEPLVLTTTTQIKARTRFDNTWSALNEATFRVVERDSQLRLTEIMYNPADLDDYEFIELQNTGNTTLDLSGFYFEGIEYIFPASAEPLAPGEFVVLVRNPAAFARRYPNVDFDGVYTGQLSNRGEQIALRDSVGELVISVSYDDENGWPVSPDGRGDSLVLHNLAGDPDNPKNWQASTNLSGSPGAPDPGQVRE